MKILTQEESKELLKKPIIDDILAMECGQSCFVDKGEWKYKSNISSIIINRTVNSGMSFRVRLSPSVKGWVVTRTS